MTTELSSDIKHIGKALDKYWNTKPDKKLPRKPKFKVVFIYSGEGNEIDGFLYAHDIDDGYFRDCIIDELTVKDKSDERCIEDLLKKLIAYCKKEKIPIKTWVERKDKLEIKILRKLGFDVEENKDLEVSGYKYLIKKK
jgi:hypothetical protein